LKFLLFISVYIITYKKRGKYLLSIVFLGLKLTTVMRIFV